MIAIEKKKREYTPARKAANEKYNEKTYRRYSLYLRVDDDREIIDSIEKAVEKDIPIRIWLKELFEGNK